MWSPSHMGQPDLGKETAVPRGAESSLSPALVTSREVKSQDHGARSEVLLSNASTRHRPSSRPEPLRSPWNGPRVWHLASSPQNAAFPEMQPIS